MGREALRDSSPPHLTTGKTLENLGNDKNTQSTWMAPLVKHPT